MAFIEPDDFDRKFDDRFYNDMNYICDKINDRLDDLERNYGGQFSEVLDRAGEYRTLCADLVDRMITLFCYDGNESLGNVISDAVTAAIVICAGKCRNRGNRDSDEFIKDEFRDNPILIEFAREGRRGRERDRGGRDRDSGRRRGSNDRYTSRSSERGARSSAPRRRESYQRHDDRSERSAPRGAQRSSALAKRREEEPRNNNRNEQREKQEVSTNQNVQVSNGDIITRENMPATGLTVGMAYIAGNEQVVYEANDLTLQPFTGTTAVDYEKHRIDRFYPDILAAGRVKGNDTMDAIKKAQDAMTQKIEAYISDPTNPEAEPQPNFKVFHTSTSAIFDEEMEVNSTKFDPIFIRDNIMDQFDVDINWFTKNALVVEILQKIKIGNVSNDTLDMMVKLFNLSDLTLFVKELTLLIDRVSPSIWKVIHDMLTARVNVRLLKYNLPVQVESIVADWQDLLEFLKAQPAGIAENLAKLTVPMDGIVAKRDKDDGETAYIYIQRKTLYLPVSSSEFDLCTTDPSGTQGYITPDSPLFKIIDELGSTPVGKEPICKYGGYPYLVTLDGEILSTHSLGNIAEPKYLLRKMS